MNDMTWAASKGSPRMSSHPRPLSWIVVLVGALAIFLIYASWVLVSYPIGATVHGYFYGIGSSEKLDLSVSPINEASIDANVNRSLDLVDDKPSSDLQSSTISNGLSSDSKVKQTDTKSNSPVDLSESTSVKFPMNKEDNSLETSDAAVSNSQEPVTAFDNSADVTNSSLPAQANSQIDLTSSATMPVAGTNSSNVTDSVRTEEPASVILINQSSAVTTTSNETSLPNETSSDSTSTAVPASLEKPNNASYTDSVNSGCRVVVVIFSPCTSLLSVYHFI